MDKKTILDNVASMTADQLFEEIKAGTVSLEEINDTGVLENTKRNKIRKLQEQYETKDKEAWDSVRYTLKEEKLSDYIQNFPNGKYVQDAKDKMDEMDRDRKKRKAAKQGILDKIRRNPNDFSYIEIIAFLDDGTISKEDLLDCSIPQSAIDNLQKVNVQKLIIGKTPDKIADGFTEVYFWGGPGSGKTCALGAVLQMAEKKGYLTLAQGDGYAYASQITNIFSDDGIANDYLPDPTDEEKTQYLPFTLKKDGEKDCRSVSLIELSGEIHKCFFDKISGKPMAEQLQNTFNLVISFLNDNRNRKIHFFFIEYCTENKKDEFGLNDQNYLSAAATYFTENKIFKKSTDAIYIVLTKSDLLRDEYGNPVSLENRVKYAKKYLEENNYKAFTNSIKSICRKESINEGVLPIVPFSLGKVYFEKIGDFEGSAANEVLEILMERIPKKSTSFFNFLEG